MANDRKLDVGGRELARIHHISNRRKRDTYWLGFLSGALASGRIEANEEPAIVAEARAFAEFFHDPDARDLVEDITHIHRPGSNDLFEQIQDIVDYRRRALDTDAAWTDKDAMNEFLGFCAGTICDGVVLEKEAHAMLARLNADRSVSSAPGLSNLHDVLDAALKDGFLDQDESSDVHAWIVRLVGDGYNDTGMGSFGTTGNIGQTIEHHRDVAFGGMVFVVTGALRLGPRRHIAQAIVQRSGLFHERMTLKTNYLVVAPTASRDWTHSSFGRKIEEAHGLIAKGAALRFLPEHIFEEALAQA